MVAKRAVYDSCILLADMEME